MKKRVTILGSTGSIGKQALEIIKANPDLFEVSGISCRSSLQLLKQQAKQFNVPFFGTDSVEIARVPTDIVLNAIVGTAGLAPTMAAIEAGHNVALANKESLVAGGELVMATAKKRNVKILPVDSEHSAIWQCLGFGERLKHAKSIVITASGGPFRTWTKQQLNKVTVKDALAHPTWRMGAKITIDSATLMNKGLEVIEAMHLFGMQAKDIGVVVHRQSIIHGMAVFKDNSTIAQMGYPSMEIPIKLALSYPNILQSEVEALDLARIGELSFEQPDLDKFECLKIALECAEAGGAAPVIMNAANEVAVERFLRGSDGGGIKFTQIPYHIRNALDKFAGSKVETLQDILQIDSLVRQIQVK